ncbi:MAG: glycosyltransferase family 2 protein [Calditrichaceae bacterium]|nr:glycosyltransferase family 2 protein [Calditrichia bacterium]NUQ40594.1 glycosyltransferase family 2 protein [Calditrichaceae bacterium]
MDISIIIPVYNESESIGLLYESLKEVLKKLGLDYEILIVDDGSTDSTLSNTVALAKEDARLRIIKFIKNFGQTAALRAGIEHARGEVIVTMDGDLQNDPRDIERLLTTLQEGYDIVLGWRDKRKDSLITRKIPSAIANWMIRKLTRTSLKDIGCAVRAFRSTVIKEIPLYSEMHRYLPVIAKMAGANITEIKVRHHPRKFGKSKYGLSRIYKVLLDFLALKVIWSAFHRPLFGFGMPALFMAAFSMAFLIGGLVHLLLFPGISIIISMGASMLFGTLSFFFFTCGIICDLVYQTGNLKIEKIMEIIHPLDIDQHKEVPVSS